MSVEAIKADAPMAPATKADLSQLRETAGQAVGAFFYGTLLRSMRESSFKGEYGHGGRGEEVFSAQLHDQLAERLGAAPGSGLGEIIFRSLEHQQRLFSEQRPPVSSGAAAMKERG